jgi:hypothetical protein
MICRRSTRGEDGDAGGSFAFCAGGWRVSWVDGGFVFAGSVVAVVSVSAVGVTGTSCVMVLSGSTCGEDGDGGRGWAGSCWFCRFDGCFFLAGAFVAIVTGATVFVTGTAAGVVVLGSAGSCLDGDRGSGGAGRRCWLGRFDSCLLFACSFVAVVVGATVLVAGTPSMVVLCCAGSRLDGYRRGGCCAGRSCWTGGDNSCFLFADVMIAVVSFATIFIAGAADMVILSSAGGRSNSNRWRRRCCRAGGRNRFGRLNSCLFLAKSVIAIGSLSTILIAGAAGVVVLSCSRSWGDCNRRCSSAGCRNWRRRLKCCFLLAHAIVAIISLAAISITSATGVVIPGSRSWLDDGRRGC